MQRALVGFTETANLKLLCIPFSGVIRSDNRKRERGGGQHKMQTTVQALDRRCCEVTADMRCPKSQSHGKYLMSGW